LQRYILAEAGKQDRLYYADVLMGFYGWQPHREPRYYQGERSLGYQLFSRKKIGESVYRKTMAALSRSCRRLQDRGLVKWICGAWSHWSGVVITDAGREWLSVNSCPRAPSVNR
jgi:hypothetical protein